jgi:hypothetical protein
VEATDPVRERPSGWTRRSVELNARIRDLHERNAQLSNGFGPPDLERARTAGSSPDQVEKAKTLAKMAHVRALEAVQRSAMMRLHAASAHDRAAQLHELLADSGRGDIQDHRERAAAHRRQAREDRAAADVILRSRPAEPPEPEDS